MSLLSAVGVFLRALAEVSAYIAAATLVIRGDGVTGGVWLCAGVLIGIYDQICNQRRSA